MTVTEFAWALLGFAFGHLASEVVNSERYAKLRRAVKQTAVVPTPAACGDSKCSNCECE